MNWIGRVLCFLGIHSWKLTEWIESGDVQKICKRCYKERWNVDRKRKYTGWAKKGYVQVIPTECGNEHEGKCDLTSELCVAYQPSCDGFYKADEKKEPYIIEAGIICHKINKIKEL